MHREYEEIESHATMAEFFSETSMSDSALEQRSDRLLLKREGANGGHEMQEGTTVLEKPKKGTKHKPPEKAQVPKGEPEPKSTHKVGGNGRASGKSGEKRKEQTARKESRRISDASREEESDGEPVEIPGDTRARKRKPVVAETSEETNVSERRRRHSKVEERVVRRVSSSESIAESRSEVTETDEDSVTKKTTQDKGRTSKKQSRFNIIADSSPGKPKLSGKKAKKPKKSTSRDSSQEDRDDDHAKAESEVITTEVCEEEEIIERHATESIVEVLETKISGKLCKDLSIDTDGPPKRTKGRIKDETVLHEQRKDGRSKDKQKPKNGRTTSGHGSPDRHESGGSLHSASSVEVFKEAESSEEITSFTKEASSMQRSSELVTSEEIVQKSSREEIVQHTSEISVKGGESTGAPESPPSASVHHQGIKHLQSSRGNHPLKKYPTKQKTSEEIDTASQERYKDTTEEEKQTHSEHEERLSASRIPPLVADAVSDLFSQVKQSTTASTSPYEKSRPMRDAASSPVLGPTTVEIACGSDDAYLMDAGCNPRQYSIEVSEKGNSPGENAYTAEAACSTVAEETKSAACSPAIDKVDASCSPLESVDQPPVQDETCSPISTDIGKPREKVDASCSPILELAEELAETKEAACSPVVTSVPAEKTDTASSPAEITKTADAQSSPIAVSIDQKDSSSSPILKMFQQDEESSPIAVEVEDKETYTSPQEETTLDSSCTPLWSTEMLERAKAAAVEKADTASSPVGVQPTRDEECSPIVADLGGDTRDAACSPIDIGLDERPEKRDLVSAAISPIPSQLSDKATSPPDTATTVHAGVSPFPPTPGVEKGSSPHVAPTRDASCSPFEDQFQASGKLGTAATAEKPATADVCSETSPEEQKPAMKADVADAACSPVAFEFCRLSRSSSGSTEVDIAVRSSSLEEVTKTPTTDIAAIPSLRETGTSTRVGTKEGVVGDSTSALGMSTIVDTGTSPFAPLAQARGTSTEGKAAQLALSDSGTSPLESTTAVKGTNTRDAANSPIETAPAAGRKTLKDVIRLKKPLPLRKTRSWDTMGYGSVDETRPKEFLFPDIRLPSRIDQLIATTPGSTSPGQHGASPDKLSAEDARQLQKLPSIIKTASTPPETAVVTGGSPGGTMDVRELKKPSLQPIGVKRHSLTQSDYDRSPESSVRSSDLTANTLKDSGFSDVEKHVSGGSSAEEEDRSDRQGVFSDSAAHELELQRRKLLSRRKMREGDEDVSPGREDTDGSAVEDDATAGRARERLPAADKRGGPSGDTDVKMNGRREGVKGQRRRRGQPELRPVTESRKPPEDITMAVQESLRKYRVERQLFSELQELKRHQIRSGRTHENVLVKRLVDRFRELVLAPGMRDFAGPYTFRNYERYLYEKECAAYVNESCTRARYSILDIISVKDEPRGSYPKEEHFRLSWIRKRLCYPERIRSGVDSPDSINVALCGLEAMKRLKELRETILSRCTSALVLFRVQAIFALVGLTPLNSNHHHHHHLSGSHTHAFAYACTQKSDDYEDSGAVSDGPLECVSRAYGLGRAADDYAAEAETGADAVKAGEHSGPQGGMAVDAAERRSREAEALEPMASQSSRSGPPLQPVGRKNLLPAILPSPLTSVFTVVRGAPPLPAARTGYGHVRSRVFPQQPSQKVQLTESDRSPRKTPPAPVRAKKEAATNTTEVASNQASRLRLERIRKQREEEDRLRKIRAEKASKVATEVTSRSHGSVQNLRRISEEESLERAAATDGALSEQESEHAMKRKQHSTSLTREAMRRTKGDAQAEKSPAKEPRKPVAARASDGSKKPATSGRQPARLHESPQATADTNKPVFPYLKKREGRLSVSRAEESRDSRVSVVTKSRDADQQERMTASHSTSRRPAASPEPLETMAGKRPAEPTTPRRPFSKARETTAPTPKQSSALLPFWVPHDPTRTEAGKALQEKHHRSKVRESLGEQQAVRFKDWIKARQQSSATSVERASIAAADAATEALAREVRLREGDSSETDSGHEGDGILPDDQKVKEVLLEKVSRSLKKNVLPQDVVTMRLKPSPPAAVDDQIEAITRTVRMSEFLEAARRDIVVNCVQLRPDNVSEGSASPEGVPSPAASSGGGGSVSDGAAVEDDDGVLEFEIRHGREKNVFWLPTSKIRDNKKWQVTFIVARADQE
ncbi:hypothetical protein HPB48_020829 [Haemaphysalis longicornis]|uniref:Uncharacterized protein n=1 Tax=Haemaphysalis longicornis TaxID=44386 RepID=A0A9J6GBE4_HAELO|nr:hypothetical protein HPB48_020829 [Haemaphysalis longicornis]